MKAMRYIGGFIIVFCFFFKGMCQVGEKVRDVEILNLSDKKVGLPGFGEKNLLIFYADPSHAKQNKNLQDYFKSHPVRTSKVDSYGVINLAAAPLIPKGIVKRKAAKAIKGTDGQVYFDTDSVLSKAWNLKNANDASCVILVDKDRVIRFYKAGQVSQSEMQQVINMVNDWK